MDALAMSSRKGCQKICHLNLFSRVTFNAVESSTRIAKTTGILGCVAMVLEKGIAQF